MKRVLVVGAGIASGVLAQTLSPHFDLTVLEKVVAPGADCRPVASTHCGSTTGRRDPRCQRSLRGADERNRHIRRDSQALEPATVLYETRVERVELGRVWAVDGRCFETDWIVLTAPLPQVSQIVGRPTTAVYDGGWVAMVSGPRDVLCTVRQDSAGQTAVCGKPSAKQQRG
ncbi:MAG: hypothetical protein R3E66_09340 [bacterium]